MQSMIVENQLLSMWFAWYTFQLVINLRVYQNKMQVFKRNKIISHKLSELIHKLYE